MKVEEVERRAEAAIALMPENTKNELLRSFIAYLIVTRAAREVAKLKDFEGWTNEFAGYHDILEDIAGNAGIVVNCTGIGKDGKGNFELVIPEDEEEGGADE